MNAYLNISLRKGFYLSEESLIRLDDIIRKRLQLGDSDQGLVFKVFRDDGMLIKFDVVSQVVSEENSTRNAVKRVDLLSDSARHKLLLCFDRKDGVDLKIESDDRDLAYLLFSDIKEYLNSEVLKYRSYSFDSIVSSKLMFPLLMMAFSFYLLYVSGAGLEADVADRIIAGKDVNEKLNFLIKNRMKSDGAAYIYPMIGFFVLMLGSIFAGGALDKLFPRNIFYWGKAQQTYDKLVRSREKWLWGVGIAFFIGIASTVAVDFLKRVN